MHGSDVQIVIQGGDMEGRAPPQLPEVAITAAQKSRAPASSLKDAVQVRVNVPQQRTVGLSRIESRYV